MIIHISIIHTYIIYIYTELYKTLIRRVYKHFFYAVKIHSITPSPSLMASCCAFWQSSPTSDGYRGHPMAMGNTWEIYGRSMVNIGKFRNSWENNGKYRQFMAPIPYFRIHPEVQIPAWS